MEPKAQDNSVGKPAARTGARIWLIAPDWRVRALIRAQLLEAGDDVTAMESWAALGEHLRDQVLAPDLLIVQLTGDEPPGVLSELASLPVPRLVLRGIGAPGNEALRAAGIDVVLSRPYSVGEVVEAARTLLGEVGGRR
jgi:DNA-binding response OmpR family regulator